MPTLKTLIHDYVEENFSQTSYEQKSLLKMLSLKKILSNSYYKDLYYTTSIAIKNDKQFNFVINEYDIGSRIINKSLFEIDNDIPDINGFYNVQKYLVNKEVSSRINTFIEINKLYSDNIHNYVEKIIEAQKGDDEFLNTVYSFQYLIPQYETLFFNENVNKLMEFNGLKDTTSILCKNTFPIVSYDRHIFEWDLINIEWKSKKQDRDIAINKTLNLFENIDLYYDKHNKEISMILDFIKCEKEYLFKNTNEQIINFSYYEVKGNYENDRYSFKLQDKLNISKDILDKNNIFISDLYSLNIEPDEYKSLKQTIMNELMKKEDDISPYIKSRYYGLDFLNLESMQDSPYAKSYILAKVNNDVVGFISYKSTDAEGLSAFKTIEYVCVKDNFRSTGLSEKLYDKLASILEENGNLLTNSHYTEQGRIKLPRLKQRIRDKHPEFLMIDTDLGYSEDLTPKEQKIMDIKSYFNESFCIDLKTLEKKNPELFKTKIKDIAKLYNDSIRYIDNHKKAFTHEDRAISQTIRSRFMIKQKDLLLKILKSSKVDYKKRF